MVSLLLCATADQGYRIFWMPTKWSEICFAILRSLFVFTFPTRLRGNKLVFALWADASDRPRGSRTRSYVATLATEELHGHGPEHDVSVMS